MKKNKENESKKDVRHATLSLARGYNRVAMALRNMKLEEEKQNDLR